MAPHNWGDLLKGGGINKLQVGEIRTYLKEHKLAQTGDKGMMVARIRVHWEGKGLLVGEKSVYALSMPELKKACAQRGIMPDLTKDELYAALVEKLAGEGGAGGAEKEAGGGGAEKEAGGGDAKMEGGGADPISVAKRVLELGEEQDWEGVLSSLPGFPAVTRSSPTAVLRKQYYKLSALVHPDKLERKFKQATKAFQLLVTAYERLSQPELYAEEEKKTKKGEKKQAKIQRSNQGCHRTRISCPRCRQEWGTKVSGNPDYFYNFLMQGYKSFTCDTCLFEFGCMAAEHECPKCNSKFDYHPNDYHRKITCTNTKCSQEFGFYMFNVSERVENELRDELKRSQEKWARSQEQRARRAERAVRNAVVEGGVEDVALEAFARGLSNACPLCGSDAFKSTEEQRGHAASCVMDTKAHAVHQKNLARKRAREDAAAGVQQAQEEIQNRAAWEFAGGSTAELWRLALPGLKSLCKDAGLPSVEENSEA